MIKAWSYTKYSDWKQCPRKFKLKHIDRAPEVKGPALLRGAEIHDAAASYITGKGKLPPELKEFEAEFLALRRQWRKEAFPVENEWAFKIDWTATSWTDWDAAWVRIKLDLCKPISDTTVHVLDWKTGKFREQNKHQYMEQMELYSLAVMLTFPDIEAVHPQLVYLDANVVYPNDRESLVYRREQLEDLKLTWVTRTRPMFEDREWEKRPTVLCGWCSYKGRECK